MFCPQCRNEYPAGQTRCERCGLDLVDELPTGADVVPLDLVTVFETGDQDLIPVVRALLEAEQIPCVVDNEPVTEPFPGVSAIAGPALVRVPAALAEAARALIADRTSELAEDSTPEEPGA